MNDTALVKLDAAQHALAECKTAMEAKHIADVAEAARVYLERTNATVETVNRATEVRVLAERQMGKFLKGMPKNQGALPGKTGTKAVPVLDTTPTLAEIGITKNQSAASQKLAAIPEPEFRERVEQTKASGQRLTTRRIIEPGFTPRGKAAGDEAEKDSGKLWRLKCLWKKTNKRDRAAFLAWTHNQ